MYKVRFFGAAIVAVASVCVTSSVVCVAQEAASNFSSSADRASAPVTPSTPRAATVLSAKPWEYGPFFNGGVGTGDRSNYSFLAGGFHLGKVLGSPIGPSFLRGQFEFAGDVMPWWQGRTPKFERANCALVDDRFACSALYPTGGAYNGISITPIILRWNLAPGRRFAPFLQGAGGLVWTNHKYPPVGPFQQPNKQGASVWNFTPQFGIGVHYFLRPRQSITVQANAVHISSASLGDTNPGVNASVQFMIGYTWWK